eukprot:5761446-Alexandrium_andersonii.AAC.1
MSLTIVGVPDECDAFPRSGVLLCPGAAVRTECLKLLILRMGLRPWVASLCAPWSGRAQGEAGG